jgi:hypothetical protein
MNVNDLAQGWVILPAHDEMFHCHGVMTGIVIEEVTVTATTIKKNHWDLEETGMTTTLIETQRSKILAAGGTTENGMNAWQWDGSVSNANEKRMGCVTALLRGIPAIVRIADGLLLMIVMVETSEQLAERESLTRRRTRAIVRTVTENAREKERRSRLGWTHTSLLLAATV